MEKELLERIEKIEQQLSAKKRDFWEKLQILTPLLIPVVIALVGWYFTNQYNSNQLDILKINNENQFDVAVINSNVGQSALIKDFMHDLTGTDTSVRNIAIEAILYAAPTPGKRIVEIIAKMGDGNTRKVVNDALAGKRSDLISNLFSTQRQNRVIAANEISSNWTKDNSMLKELIDRANQCLTNNNSSTDCDNGVYNTVVVLSNFSTVMLSDHKQDLKTMIAKIPKVSQLTLNLGNELLKKVE